MTRNNDQEKLEVQLRTAIEGYRSVPAEVPTLLFPEGRLLREEVTGHSRKGLDLIAEVRHSQSVHEAATEAMKNAIPGLRRFHAQTMDVAQRHVGSDPTPGCEAPKGSGSRVSRSSK